MNVGDVRDSTGSSPIYSKEVAEVCLNCPYPKCRQYCTRFAAAVRAQKKPTDRRGRRGRNGA